jgi:hypothetical protein
LVPIRAVGIFVAIAHTQFAKTKSAARTKVLRHVRLVRVLRAGRVCACNCRIENNCRSRSYPYNAQAQKPEVHLFLTRPFETSRGSPSGGEPPAGPAVTTVAGAAISAAAIAALATAENLVHNIDGFSPPKPSAVVIPIDHETRGVTDRLMTADRRTMTDQRCQPHQ